jgi:two-component system nitrate/nitrite response regulator NarL
VCRSSQSVRFPGYDRSLADWNSTIERESAACPKQTSLQLVSGPTLESSVTLMIRVFIAAPFRLYREGLAEILTGEDGIAVIGAAAYGREAVDSVREVEPDVVLLDPAIPEGTDAIRELVNPSATVRVVALAPPEVEAEMIAWAEAGVSGFVGFDDSLTELVATVRGVARGDLLCSPQVAGSLLRRVAILAAERRQSSCESQLTARELEVIRLIDEGLSNKQIALRLCIELPTVKHHVHHILEKLGVARRSDAVDALRRRGLLPSHVR